MEIKRLEENTPEIRERIRELMIQLSRSGKDKGEIPEEWVQDVIDSDWHDLLIAVLDGKIVGFMAMSVVMGPGIRKNAYLEDFVVDKEVREGGVGSALWEGMIEWAKEKGCKRLEFTCGKGREVAQKFYRKHGAEIYETNFFRKEI